MLDNGCGMWFGTVDYSTWIEPPLSGADSSPEGWSDDGITLNGFGWATGSLNASKVYNYSWPASSSREQAQLMRGFSDGIYGTGKVYFHEPTTYDINVLPARWASPAQTCDFEGPSLIPAVEPKAVAAGMGRCLLPTRAASFDLLEAPVYAQGSLNDSNSVFIPIPDGMQLNLGAFYSAEGATEGVYITPVTLGGSEANGTVRLTPVDPNSPPSGMFPDSVTRQPGIIGVRLWIGKTADTGPTTVAVQAIHARLSEAGVLPDGPETWVGGQGNGGVRFVGKPTYVTHSGVGGGQIEYAATLREVMV